MNVANLENSKRLFELSGWKDTEKWFGNGHESYIKHDSYGVDFEEDDVPAYDAGYLLRRMPNPKQGDGNPFSMELYTDGRWKAGYLGIQTTGAYAIGDTPEDALALLAIKLFESNILTKEKDQ